MERLSRRAFLTGASAFIATTVVGNESNVRTLSVQKNLHQLLQVGPQEIGESLLSAPDIPSFEVPTNALDAATYQEALAQTHTVLAENGLGSVRVMSTHDPDVQVMLERIGYIVDDWKSEQEAPLIDDIATLTQTLTQQPLPFLHKTLPKKIILAPAMKQVNTNECSRDKEPYYGAGGITFGNKSVIALALGYTGVHTVSHELLHQYMKTLSADVRQVLLGGVVAISRRAFQGENPYKKAYECNRGMLAQVTLRRVFSNEYSSKTAEEDLANIYADVSMGKMVVDSTDGQWGSPYHLKQQLVLGVMEEDIRGITKYFLSRATTTGV